MSHKQIKRLRFYGQRKAKRAFIWLLIHDVFIGSDRDREPHLTYD